MECGEFSPSPENYPPWAKLSNDVIKKSAPYLPTMHNIKAIDKKRSLKIIF